MPSFQPYWGKPAVRNDRGDGGDVGIIRSPVRASILPDYLSTHEQEAKLWELCATVCLAPLGPTRIAVALELIGAQAARRSEHRDALDLLLRARATVVKPPTRENRAERIGTYERALEIDPGSIETQSWLANSLAGRVLSNMTETPEADLARAEELVERA